MTTTHQNFVDHQPDDELAIHHPQISDEPDDDHQPDGDAAQAETTAAAAIGIETSCRNDNLERNNGSETDKDPLQCSSASGLKVEEGEAMRDENETSSEIVEENGRERLKRHRIEVAGRVWIPEIWGQEELLKDWIDCSAFDASLVPNGIMSARAALVEEGRRANSGGFRIENRQCNDESGKLILVTKNEL
ncbi:hypothetical protein CCACVL1_12028 [Corchorus capsularis]|uniref:Protein BIC1 n=1 Tax=Corchorus capsularis TaxID=210143 RepID=A0A1R3II58_COCAP|nr:hypothetical protein CCACVL1_12028 [Corchorus capsularis]